MSIFSRWDNLQQTIMQIVFEKGWTWADYVQAENEIDARLDSVDWQVHLIIDMRGAQALPGGSALSEIMRSFAEGHDNLGMVVIVGANKVLQLLLRTMQRLTPSGSAQHIRFAADPEEARGILRSVFYVRQSLSDSAFAAEVS